MNSKITQCKADIKALEENLKKLQWENEEVKPKVGDRFRHKVYRNIRMVCLCNDVEYFVTINNTACMSPKHFPLGGGHPFSHEKKFIIAGTSVWEKV